MIKYLLDTNICAFFLCGKYNLDKKLNEVGITNCAVSEITMAELKYGIELSSRKEKNLRDLNKLIMVSDNIKHLSHIESINMQNWIER
jgi:predicted nucleic acid-binding protein